MAFVFHYSFYVYFTLYQHFSWWGDPNLYLRITEPLLVLFILGCQFFTELYYWNGSSKKWCHESPGFETYIFSALLQHKPNFPGVISFFSCWFHAVRCPKMARDKLSFRFIRTMARFLGGNIVLLEINTPNLSSPWSWRWKQKFYSVEYYCNRRATPNSFLWFLAPVFSLWRWQQILMLV